MREIRVVSPAKWAYMQEIGRTRYIVTRTLGWLATWFAACVSGGFFAGATVHTVSWWGLGASTLVMGPIAFFRLRAYWDQCEASVEMHRPTIHTPRFEGEPPAERRGARTSA